MVFLVNKICTKLAFLSLGATLCHPKSIITPQIHVKLILTHTKPTNFWHQWIMDYKDIAPYKSEINH